MKNQKYEINFKQILSIAQIGVRRASVFMGFGVNAALDDSFMNYHLTHLTGLQLVPDSVPPETLSQFKNEFKTWIEGNGFRELVESFLSFLDRVHEAAYMIKSSSTGIKVSELQERQITYEKQGLPNKLNLLNSEFAIAPKHPEYIKSLNKARNCLTHRRGTVGVEDLIDGKCCIVKWLGADLFIETSSGERHLLEDCIKNKKSFPEETTVMMQMVEREKRFNLGCQIILSTRDLAEVCWFFQRESASTIEATIEYARSCGIEISD
jgi:hypothetical protein